ncbi:hypothetical protein DVH05_027841 [Phytophthora capsici]|nr:hypothetical protein DVH05_007177 [Phytophthora capsici]KAG1690792.1 hypothetical protein DVH05_027841 [Phytophthora capsici]|eukprot:jgi/Phyca11/124413/e_gw1.53.390.1
MRFFLVAALAAFAFASSCEAAVAEAPNAVQIDDNINAGFSRSLRSTDSEDRAIAQLLSEDRAVASVKVKYQSLYKAKITPNQAKVILGISDDMVELTKTTRSLQRFYTGYLSYYTLMEKRKKRKKELENQVKW